MERLRKNRKSFIPFLLIGRKVKFYLLIAVSLFLIFISIIKPEIATQIKMGAIDTASPILEFISKPFEEASESINSISNIAALKAENSKLRTENTRLKDWYQTALMLSAENQALQSLLNLKIDSEIEYISARVLFDTQNTFSKTILIAAGKNENIEKDQVVLSGDGVIGRVIKAGEKISRVLLITDLNSRIPVTIEGVNKKAIISGNNNDDLLIKHLDITGNEILNKKVITTGEGGIFPAGLYVGTIKRIEGNQIFVNPFSKLDHFQFVRILQKSSKLNDKDIKDF